MTETLTIDHIVAHTQDDREGLAARIERLMRHVVDDRLARTLGHATLAAEGEWCIPRVSLSAALDLERPDTSLEEQLAQAIISAIAAAVRDSDVVGYPHPVDALADLVASASLGRFDRAWVWSRIGLIDDATELERQPGACSLEALTRRPFDALAAVVRAVNRVGLAPVHRLFTEVGWSRLADSVIEVHTASHASVTGLLHTCIDSPTAAETVGMTFGADCVPAASQIIDSSLLAHALRTSRLRLDATTMLALAILVVAESEPAVMARAAVTPLVLTVAKLMQGAIQPVHVTPRTLDQSVARRSAESFTAAGPSEQLPTSPHVVTESVANVRPPDSETQPDDAPVEILTEPGQATRHAGLLFLLNVASDASMPEALLDDPVLEGLDATQLLARLALVLCPMRDDDPALLAFARLDEKWIRPGWSDKALSPNLFERIRTHADAWATAVAVRMGRGDEEPGQVVAAVVDRTGRIECEQGWIDVNLALADVDIDVRRAGLDLDPGWVPWLGSVVRFRYV